MLRCFDNFNGQFKIAGRDAADFEGYAEP